MTENTS